MSDFQDRVDKLRGLMAEADIDCFLITHPSNRLYLTGFTGDDMPPNESSGHVFITPDRAILITGGTNANQAIGQAPDFEVVVRDGDWINADHLEIMKLGAHKVAFEPNAMLVGVFDGITAQLEAKGHDVEWVPNDGMVEQLRIAKTADEIALLRKAFEITSEAYNRVAPTIKAGDTEHEVAWRIHQAFVELGAEGPAFPTIVAAGRNAARAHHEPGDYVIQEGDPIVIDMGAKYHGYCADLTRTYCVGEPTEKFMEIYTIVSKANDLAIEHAQTGVKGKDLDKIARDYISSFGYGDQFSHGLGHGVGVRVHEAPSASRMSEDVLGPGMFLTIEPGIYLPEWGGVRVEDVVLITEDGLEVVTSANKIDY